MYWLYIELVDLSAVRGESEQRNEAYSNVRRMSSEAFNEEMYQIREFYPKTANHRPIKAGG